MCEAKRIFEQRYQECMERMIAGDTSPAEEEDTLAQFSQMVPKDYTTRDFIKLLLTLKEIKNSCIYLIWYRRLILSREPLCVHMEEPEGKQFVNAFFCGDWITPQEEQTEEFEARFQMMLDVVTFFRGREEKNSELPQELRRILDFDNVQLVAKAIKSGLLRDKHAKVCIDYCLERKLLQAVPYLLVGQNGREEYVYA